MTPVPLHLPDYCQVTGQLVASDDPLELPEDMLEIQLPNGILVTAGWFDEGDRGGSYYLEGTLGLNHVKGYSANNPQQAKTLLEQLVNELAAL